MEMAAYGKLDSDNESRGGPFILFANRRLGVFLRMVTLGYIQLRSAHHPRAVSFCHIWLMCEYRKDVKWTSYDTQHLVSSPHLKKISSREWSQSSIIQHPTHSIASVSSRLSIY